MVDRTEYVDQASTRPAAAPLGARPEKVMPAFSAGATFMGWCVASFVSLLMLVFVGGALAAGGTEVYDVADPDGVNDVTPLTSAGVVVGLASLFVGYLVGGYAAGRIGLWRGAAHGAAVPAWTLLLGIVIAVIGLSAADEFVDATGISPPNVDLQDVAGPASVALILSLVVMFGAAVLGGLWGQRYDQRGQPIERRRLARRRAGRPL